MQILLNIGSIGNKTTIQNTFNMWTSSPKLGKGTIQLTIALLSNKTLIKIYLQKWDKNILWKAAAKTMISATRLTAVFIIDFWQF